MRLILDEALCSGHGRCYDVAPDLIESDDEGRGRVMIVDVPPELGAQARAAVANCPERAIRVLP